MGMLIETGISIYFIMRKQPIPVVVKIGISIHTSCACYAPTPMFIKTGISIPTSCACYAPQRLSILKLAYTSCANYIYLPTRVSELSFAGVIHVARFIGFDCTVQQKWHQGNNNENKSFTQGLLDTNSRC